MVIVDSHVHASKNWFEPVEILLYQMKTNGVSKAIIITYDGSTDNGYELENMRKYPSTLKAVVQVDSKKPDAPAVLKKLADEGATGVRLRPYEPSPGPDPFILWRTAEELGLAVSAHGSIQMFADASFAKMIESLPRLKIVLEHLGGAAITHAFPKPEYELFENVLALAKYPNIYIKIPGFGELLPRPFPFRVPAFGGPPPILKKVYDTFGSHHMMWGSDFPPCAAREGYANALQFPMGKVPFFTQEDKEWIFGKTALSFWDKP
jgi:L-fuconolactonase